MAARRHHHWRSGRQLAWGRGVDREGLRLEWGWQLGCRRNRQSRVLRHSVDYSDLRDDLSAGESHHRHRLRFSQSAHPVPLMLVDATIVEKRRTSPWADALRRLLRNRAAVVGVFLIAIFVGSAVLAPLLSPYQPNAGSLLESLQPPSAVHWMGTDTQGRDELSRVLYGARVSLSVGLASVLVSVLLGCLVGAVAGAVGGIVDNILMRTVDVVLAIPGILLAIGIVAFLDRGLPQITLAVAVANAPMFARLQRGSVLVVRESEYVLAARSVGVPITRIVLRHMLPDALTPVIVVGTLAIRHTIV